LAKAVASHNLNPEREPHWLAKVFDTARCHTDIAVLAGLMLLVIHVDSNDLDAHDALVDQVTALIETGEKPDPLTSAGTRSVHATYLMKRGEVEQALTEMVALLAFLRQPANLPETGHADAQCPDRPTLSNAATACGYLRRNEDMLRHAEELTRLRALRGAPAADVAQPVLDKAQGLVLETGEGGVQ